MSLPPELKAAGFLTPAEMRKARKRHLMIGTDGPSDSGKTEFALSAPGPGVVLALDRGHEGALDNPNPPQARRSDFAFKVIRVPQDTEFSKAEKYGEYWMAYLKDLMDALKLPVRTLVVDGDSDSWELQRLAEFGRLTKIPPILYDKVNAARRAIYTRLFDSGKIIICTNKVKKTYADKLHPTTGEVMLSNNGEAIREWDGGYSRQGFADQDFAFQIQLRHYYLGDGKWGVRIMKCKQDKSLEGMDLEGEECNMQSLLQTVFPNVELSEWGY